MESGTTSKVDDDTEINMSNPHHRSSSPPLSSDINRELSDFQVSEFEQTKSPAVVSVAVTFQPHTLALSSNVDIELDAFGMQARVFTAVLFVLECTNRIATICRVG